MPALVVGGPSEELLPGGSEKAQVMNRATVAAQVTAHQLVADRSMASAAVRAIAAA
ncbi:hypothetical protein [Streptomyces sp. NPDC094466]|uniref:hypothetical protein n=1 Tax=Streptomyces sp. NPDC094466 TaxID=3366065 RepID=UPI0038186ED5